MNKQQRDYAKAKQAKRRVEMKMEAREETFLKGRGLMDSEGNGRVRHSLTDRIRQRSGRRDWRFQKPL